MGNVGDRITYRRRWARASWYTGTVRSVANGWAIVRCDNGHVHTVQLDHPDSVDVRPAPATAGAPCE